MIRKIEGCEYLKRYDNMTAQEREDYESVVGQWLKEKAPLLAGKCNSFEAQMQNILQMGLGWNDRECQAFDEGVKLLTALVNTGETWLPDMLYVKSVKRVVKRMTMVLATAVKPVAEAPKNSGATPSKVMTITKETAQRIVEKYTNRVKEKMEPNEGTTANQDATPARPKHIDQYVHLLPQKTQEHAAQVQGLYRELDEARQKMALLMDDQTATPADREAWAKKATKCDNALRKIFDELDAEWANLVKSGRVIVDDLGMARNLTPDPSPKGEGSDQTSDIRHQTSDLTSEQKARRRELRKWLTDTRRGNGAGREERVKQWYVNFKEYLTLEGDKAFEDEKIKEAIAHYGIDNAALKEENKL
jgi:hypothetical protein